MSLPFISPFTSLVVHFAAMWLIVTFPWSVVALNARSMCYDFQGSEMAFGGYGPCNTTDGATASSCCRIYNKIPDVCTMSGLCVSMDEGVVGELYAVGCTDPNGTAEGCLTLCDNVRAPDWKHAHVTYCENGYYCCRKPEDRRTNDEVDCCNNTKARVSIDDVATKLLSNSNASSDNKNSTTSDASQQSTNSVLSHPNGENDNTVAIVAGVLGGVLLLVVVAFFVLFVRRRRHVQSGILEQSMTHYFAEAGQEAIMEAPSSPNRGLEIGGTARSELHSSPLR